MRTAYAVAFSDDCFLMVWHKERMGWEMPGGHVEPGETSEEAVKREFMEESGYSIEVVSTMDIGHCDVCAAVILDKVSNECEMKSSLFQKLPSELSFDRKEYEFTVPWAKSEIEKIKNMK